LLACDLRKATLTDRGTMLSTCRKLFRGRTPRYHSGAHSALPDTIARFGEGTVPHGGGEGTEGERRQGGKRKGRRREGTETGIVQF